MTPLLTLDLNSAHSPRTGKCHRTLIRALAHRLSGLSRATLLAHTLACALLIASTAAPLPATAASDSTASTQQPEFLDPEVAFRSSVKPSEEGRHLVISWEVAAGYHLYGGRMAVNAASDGVVLGEPQRAPGKIAFDPILGETVESLGGRFDVTVPIDKAPSTFAIELVSQGCADAGLCYPPQTRKVDVVLASAVGPGPTAPSAPVGTRKVSASTAIAPSFLANDDSGVSSALNSGSLLRVVPLFLMLGLLLSFTPCVLPMVPILSSIIVGRGTQVTRGRGFALSAAYSLGMATVYTGMGVAAGLAGEGIAGALQHPAVLGTFALLLAGLALSMFDAFPLQMPSSIQTKLMSTSDKLPGGRLAGVFGMGALSALIVGPCVAAPLAGALMYIGSTHDVVLGGFALFAMACGMSVPLLLTGLSAGSLLPKAGAWMVGVKSFFGVLLLGVALWMVTPVLPTWLTMLGWGLLAIGCASWLRAFDPLPESAKGTRRLGKALGMAAFLAGAMQLAGIALGSDDPLHPLAPLSVNANAVGGERGTPAASGAGSNQPRFRTISSSAELDGALQQASRPVMVDFYADWCVACKEMERFTFTDTQVKAQLQHFELLRADVTRNDEASRQLMKRFGLFGPPGLVFIQPQHGEISGSRVIGYKKAPEMVAHLERLVIAPQARVDSKE